MITKVQSWGNSQGLRLNRQVLADANISVGDEVNLTVRDGVILVAPAKRMRGGCDLKRLVAQIPRDYKPEVVNWGKPVGREVW
ncbi:MAG: AbrB/MazE/SpoVT family DNA-binding domain-containing protein [Lentisphaerae bacterium]|nr:AbrB/MazE/SpoVT family DNA-binding domain-containing protein [Lentisphaerota bacterium]